MSATLEHIFGIGKQPNEMTLLQMCNRGMVVFVGALVLIRLADKRFLSNKTGFDMLFALVLGSSLSRAINGTAPLFKTLAVGLLIVVVHRALAKLAFHSAFVCGLLKGHSEVILREGKLDPKVMARNDVTEADIAEDMRLKAQVGDYKEVREARIERNGEISFIPVKE